MGTRASASTRCTRRVAWRASRRRRSSAKGAYIRWMDRELTRAHHDEFWGGPIQFTVVRVSGEPDSGSLKGLLVKVSPSFFFVTSIRKVQSPFLYCVITRRDTQ